MGVGLGQGWQRGAHIQANTDLMADLTHQLCQSFPPLNLNPVSEHHNTMASGSHYQLIKLVLKMKVIHFLLIVLKV